MNRRRALENSSVVWIDFERARVIHLSDERMERSELKSHEPLAFYALLASSLADSDRILILGPGTFKTQFLKYLQSQCPSVAKHVVGCESAEQPSDAEIADYAIKYFRSA